MPFDPNDHLIKMQGGKTYLPAAARLVWFRMEHPDWTIITKPVEINMEKQYAIFSASISDDKGKVLATGTKMENVKGFGDWIEKAETGAVSRALAMCGFGTQFAPEFDAGIPTFEGAAYDQTPQPAQPPGPRTENRGAISPTPQTQRPTPKETTAPPGHDDAFDREMEAVSGPTQPQEADAFDPLACSECGKPINQNQSQYTTKTYGKPLCVNHKQMADRAIHGDGATF